MSAPAENTYDRWIMNSLALGGSAHFTGPGPGNAQILGSFFGLSANPVNQPPGGGVGTNYAIGGAFNDATLGKGIENLFPTIPIPIIGGSLFGSPNENLPGTAQQIDNYLGSVNGHANPNALYLISSGGNNAFYASMTFGSDAE
jgi:outer membrane lipase/esterase